MERLRLLERVDGFNAANPIETQNYAKLALASVYIRVARDFLSMTYLLHLSDRIHLPPPP